MWSACDPQGVPQVSDKALAHPERRTALQSVLRAWLPLSEAVLGMVVEHLPNPRQARCWRTRGQGGVAAWAG